MSLPVAYAVAARVLVVAFGSVAKVGGFSSPAIFCASFGEFCSRRGNFGACAFASLAALAVWACCSVCLSSA